MSHSLRLWESVGEEPKDSQERIGQRKSIKAIRLLLKLEKKDASLREVNVLMGKEDSIIPQQAVYNKKCLICSQN